MTTIAYKDGVIAHDGQVTAGHIIMCSNAIKSNIVNGTAFFMAGSDSDEKQFIYAYLNDEKLPKISDLQCFIVRNGMVLLSSSESRIIWSCEASKIDAIGSGRDFALAAMDLGLSAKDAVEAACKRDIYSGGKIRSYRVDSF